LCAVNKKLIATRWDTGELIEERQETDGLGKAVVERLSADLRAEFGENSSLSGRNLCYLCKFYREDKEYLILQPQAGEISQAKKTLPLDRYLPHASKNSFIYCAQTFIEPVFINV